MRKNIQKRLVRPRSLSAKVLRGKQGRARKADPRSANKPFSMPRSTCSPSAGSRLRGSTTSPPAPASPRAPFISISMTRKHLFEEVVRSAVSPILERLDALAAAPDLPTRPPLLKSLFAVFEKEVLGTKRKLLIRLIIAEGPRFSAHRRILLSQCRLAHHAVDRQLAERGVERGELLSDAFARYPQLVAAPLLLAVIWDALFAAIKPLDVADFYAASRGADG